VTIILDEARTRARACREPPTALPNVKLGIIGFETAYVVAPAHGFWLLDNDRVMAAEPPKDGSRLELIRDIGTCPGTRRPAPAGMSHTPRVPACRLPRHAAA
jgi:hypothetical protein